MWLAKFIHASIAIWHEYPSDKRNCNVSKVLCLAIESEQNLEKLNCQRRSVNNHTQVKRITDKVGAVLAEQRYSNGSTICRCCGANYQVDGGHIPIQDPEKRSFEALSAIVYRPENLHAGDQHHRQINKTCVVSARDDNLQTKDLSNQCCSQARHVSGNEGDWIGRCQ